MKLQLTRRLQCLITCVGEGLSYRHRPAPQLEADAKVGDGHDAERQEIDKT